MRIAVFASICIYLIIGVFVNGVARDEDEYFSYTLMLFWPMAIAALMFFTIVSLAHNAGKRIRKYFGL